MMKYKIGKDNLYAFPTAAAKLVVAVDWSAVHRRVTGWCERAVFAINVAAEDPVARRTWWNKKERKKEWMKKKKKKKKVISLKALSLPAVDSSVNVWSKPKKIIDSFFFFLFYNLYYFILSLVVVWFGFRFLVPLSAADDMRVKL